MGIIPIVKMYYPDELLYSWVCRLAKANGLTLKEFYREYLGAENAEYSCLNYDIKQNFVLLCESRYWKTDVVKLFLNTTTFRFEAMMMTEEQQARIVNNVFGIQNRLNTSVNKMVKNVNICPECMKEDIEKFGEPYLHCSHQLSGIQTCYKHKCLLHVFTGEKGCACDYDQKDYTEMQATISIESNNAYSEYEYALFQSNINTNKWIVRDILLEHINEMGKEQFLGEFGKWKYHDLVDYDVERVLKEKVLGRPRNLLKNELIPMAMFLYPDVNELIQKMKEKSLDSVISEYTCPNCGKTYISTPFLNEELFGCPFCNADRSEQEILSDIFEKNGYELKSEFESLGKPVLLYHRECDSTISLRPRSFLFENVRCICRMRVTYKEAKQQVENSGMFELIEYANTYSPCKIRAKECGHIFNIYYNNFLKLPRCKICFPRKETTENLANKINIETNGEYKLIGEYINADTKIKIFHNVCGTITEYLPRNYRIGKVCPVCNAKSVEENKNENWNKMYRILCDYKNTFGNTTIPAKMVYDSVSLGSWCMCQRVAYNAGTLSEERLEKLQSIGFSFDPKEDEWNRRYEQYKRYIKQNGNDILIETDFEGEHLGKWVQTQRGMYKAGKLSAERYEKLQSIGFIFDFAEEEWNRQFEQYKRYIKNNNGNPYIPQRMDYEGEHLGEWVLRQRALYKTGELSEERCEKLQSVGFILDPIEEEWNRRYEQYKRYIMDNNGNPYIPERTDYEGEHLGIWVYSQCALYKSGKMSQEHYEKLQSIGCIFGPAEDEWDRRYEQYKRYIEDNNGNPCISCKMDYEGEHLGIWVSVQRKMYKSGKILQEHYEKLQSVGFSFDPIEEEWNRRYEQYKRYIMDNGGNPYIPGKLDYEGEHLGEWVLRQRAMYKSGKLSVERYKKLQSVGFILDSKENEWNRCYELYKRYIMDNDGNPYIPREINYEGEHLGRWGYTQRAMYKSGKLPVEHYEKLKSVGFIFDPVEEEWNRHYEQYKRYIKTNNGDPYIPKHMDYEGEHLGEWVLRQRALYKTGELSEERCEKLKSIGFILDSEENEWNRRYEQYKRYIKEKNGNLFIPQKMDYEGEHLGSWVCYQRVKYRAGKLSQERYEKLKNLGMKFE